MAKLLKLRRGTTTQHGSFTGAEGEVTIDTTKDTAVVHDGSTAGGRALLREDMANLPAGTIDNADVNASAAIAGTKISPDFGSQDITTIGKIKFANMYANESDLPSATTYHGMFAHVHSTGLAYYAHGGNWIKLAKLDAPDFTGGIDVTGNINVTGSIDLEDVSEINLGTDDDFKLSYDNNNNQALISMATGKRLKLKCDSLHINNAADNSNILLADDTGSVSLFFGTGEKFKTLTGGAQVTGNLAVTGTVDGRDVASDGSKLDGIESGATADQTKSDIDGLNINADQVDGLHASSFVRNDSGNQSIAGNLTVGTGNDSYIYMVDNDNGQRSIHNNTNRIGFLKQDGNWGAYCDDSGNWTAEGNVTAYSDARLKTDISTINDALGIVGKLRGVSYKWIATDKPSIGVIAQEVEEVIPEVVLTNRDTNPSTGETTEIKSVDYGKIVGVLINAINELKAEVDALKKPKRKGGK